VSPRTGLDVVEKRNIFPCRESNPGCPARSPSRRQGHWSDKNTRCISASRTDRFTPQEKALGTHFILLQFGLTCPINCRFRGIFLKANNSGLPPFPITASERTKKKTPPHCFPVTASERTQKKTPPHCYRCLATASERTQKSKSLYDRRSVGQSIMVSSPIWGS
jgi:hypothetical protein